MRFTTVSLPLLNRVQARMWTVGRYSPDPAPGSPLSWRKRGRANRRIALYTHRTHISPAVQSGLAECETDWSFDIPQRASRGAHLPPIPAGTHWGKFRPYGR